MLRDGVAGKPDGISGGEVERYYREGRIREIADYCESDVINTYRVWLRYEQFRGRLSGTDFEASEACLVDFIQARLRARLAVNVSAGELSVPNVELPVPNATGDIA